MEQLEKEYTLSLYSNLSALRNSAKSNVFLVQNEISGKFYIKKELKTYNIEVFNALRELNHRNTPRIYEIMEIDNVLYVIEEFINGDTLEETLKEQGPMEEEQVIEYVLDLCEILKVLHEKSIIHRDIKPSNIIISNDKVLKLIDFDVSRIYKDEGSEDTYILGTKGYASPEQFGFDQTDCRSDIYSLGILMNVLTTGEYPKVKRNNGKLSGIIERCIHIAAEKRYENVMDLSEELQKLIENKKDEASDQGSSLVEKNHDENLKGYIHKTEAELNYKVKAGFQGINTKGIKSYIEELPGFRGKQPIKMMIAFGWYFTIIGIILLSLENFSVYVFLEDVVMAFALLAMTLISWNYKNIKRKLPLIRSDNEEISKFGLFIYNFIIIMIAGSALSFFDSLK